jgi:hypothetical protein
MSKDITRLLSVIKANKKPTDNLMIKLISVLPHGIHDRVKQYIKGDKRISVSKLVQDIKKAKVKVVQRGGGGWQFLELPGSPGGIGIQSPEGEIIVSRYVFDKSQSLSPTPVSPHTIQYKEESYTIGAVIGEGTFAKVHYLTPQNYQGDNTILDFVIKVFKDDGETLGKTYDNITKIISYIPKSLNPTTTFVSLDMNDIYLPNDKSKYILSRKDGSLTDAMSPIDSVDDIESNWDWLNGCIDNTSAIIGTLKKNSKSVGFIHGDLKLENVLWKGDDCFLHDLDGSLVWSQPLPVKYHGFTVRCVHPLYFAFRDFYFPNNENHHKPLRERDPPPPYITFSLMWNTYLGRIGEGNKSIFIMKIQKQLFAYLYDIEIVDEAQQISRFTKDGHEVISNFIHAANMTPGEANSLNIILPTNEQLNTMYNSDNFDKEIDKWLPYFDEFSLRCSVFIKATAWCAWYDKRISSPGPENKNLIMCRDVIYQKCQAALQALKTLVETVEIPKRPGNGVQGGRKRRPQKNKMVGGGPIKSTLPNLEFTEFMSDKALLMETVLMEVDYSKLAPNCNSAYSLNGWDDSGKTCGSSTASLRRTSSLPSNPQSLKEFGIQVGPRTPNNDMQNT